MLSFLGMFVGLLLGLLVGLVVGTLASWDQQRARTTFRVIRWHPEPPPAWFYCTNDDCAEQVDRAGILCAECAEAD